MFVVNNAGEALPSTYIVYINKPAQLLIHRRSPHLRDHVWSEFLDCFCPLLIVYMNKPAQLLIHRRLPHLRGHVWSEFLESIEKSVIE